MNQSYGRLVSRAAIAATAMASLLLLIKIFAWWYTGSVSILAALVDSLVDIGASLTNLLVVRYSLQPADDNHSFGHGKAESSRRWRKVCLSPVRHYSCFDGYSTSDISNTDDRSRRRGYRDNCGANLYDYPCLVSALGGAADAKPGGAG
ncbi:ferrous-iron efflux pump [Escherichia coli]|nr:ferrous-iron efflux pump [Escherichia coli]